METWSINLNREHTPIAYSKDLKVPEREIGARLRLLPLLRELPVNDDPRQTSFYLKETPGGLRVTSTVRRGAPADKFLIDAERWLLVQRTLTRWFPVGPYQHVNFKRKLGVTAAPLSSPLSRLSFGVASKLSILELPRWIRYPTVSKRSVVFALQGE